jgi:hypothetical protein
MARTSHRGDRPTTPHAHAQRPGSRWRRPRSPEPHAARAPAPRPGLVDERAPEAGGDFDGDDWLEPEALRPSRAPWAFGLIALVGTVGYLALSTTDTPEALEPEASAELEAPAAPAVAEPAAEVFAAAEAPAVPDAPAVEEPAVDEAPAGALDEGGGVPLAPVEDPDEAFWTADDSAYASLPVRAFTPAAGPPVSGAVERPVLARGPSTASSEAAARLFLSGRQQLDEGRAWAALARFKKAVARTPRSPDAWFGLALAHTDLRQASLARSAARKALALEPRHADATLLLGFLAQQQRDAAAARQHYERYLEFEPEGAFAGEVKTILSRLP